MLLPRPEPEADALRPRRARRRGASARTFALACRLLPARRARRRLPASTSSSARSTTSSTSDAPDAAERVAAVEAWAADGSGAARARSAVLDDLATAARRSRAHALRDFCARDARGPRRAAGSRPRPTSTATATASRARSGSSWPRCSARRDAGARAPAAAALGMAMQRTNILRDIDEDARRGPLYLARETLAASAAPAPGRARGAAARPDRARRRALRRGLAGHRRAAPGPLRDRRGGRHVPRDPAPDRARGLRRARPGRAVVSAPPQARSSPRGRAPRAA